MLHFNTKYFNDYHFAKKDGFHCNNACLSVAKLITFVLHGL